MSSLQVRRGSALTTAPEAAAKIARADIRGEGNFGYNVVLLLPPAPALHLRARAPPLQDLNLRLQSATRRRMKRKRRKKSD